MVSKSEVKRVRAQSPAVDKRIKELEADKAVLVLALESLGKYVNLYIANALKDLGISYED